MTDISTHLQIAQVIISACAGILGVGVGLGMFRGTIKGIRADLDAIKKRQAKIRGEDNGGFPMYMTRKTCREVRTHCKNDRQDKTDCLLDELNNHSDSIRGLNNFARWWMQKEGLDITQINYILKG